MFNPEKYLEEKYLDNLETNIAGVRLREIRDGMYVSRFPNGSLKVRAQVNDKGQFHGLYENFYENGQLRQKYYCKDGERDGSFEQYSQDGCLEMKCSFKNGKRDGLFRQYFKNGKVSLEVMFKDGERQGDGVSFDEQGIPDFAPKGSLEEIKWNKKASQSHRNAVLKEILKARERGDKEVALKIAEEFHTKPREKGTIAQITALKFGKDK